MKHRILWSFVIAIVLVLTFTMVVSAQETNDASTLDEVFEFKGYSFGPFGADACLGFQVNYEAKDEYEAKIERTVDIGVVFASYDDLNGKTPLDENGKPIKLENSNVLTFSLNGYAYESYDFKLIDFTPEFYSHKFVVSPYLYDGERVYYYGELGIDDNVSGVSYTEMLQSVCEHTFDSVVDAEYLRTAAACETDETYYKSCTKCAKASTDWFTAAGTALSHSYTEVVAKDYLKDAATCEGNATYYKSCALCGKASSQWFTAASSALGHSFTNVVSSQYMRTEATCVSDATYYKSCSRCGATSTQWFTASNSTVDHTYINVISQKYLRAAATCESNASYYKSCSVCGSVSTEWFEDGNTALGHKRVVVQGTPATCKQTGLTQGSYCSTCGTVFETQTVIPISGHNYEVVASKSTAPTLNAAGKKVSTCAGCSDTKTETVAKLSASKVTSDRVYSITTDEYNPALNNIWKVIDGNIVSSGIYSAGNDWFGNVGDVLTITLDQEMYLSAVYAYVSGNYTFAKVTVKNAKGEVTATGSVCASTSNCETTGDATKITAISGKNVLAYTIEFEITAIKWNSPRTFKLAELDIMAADIDLDFDHTHIYRDFVKQIVAPTCNQEGAETYACYCGKEKEMAIPVLEHSYDTLTGVVEATCTENGKKIYSCVCGKTNDVVVESKGHVYERFVKYTKEPTIAYNGTAMYQCIGCELREERVAPVLPLEDLNYLRVAEINGTTVTLKFNILTDAVNYLVKYSTSEITSANFDSATTANITVTGTNEISITFNLNAGLNKEYCVAIRPYIGDNIGEIYTIRVGGNKLIPIEDDSRVYHGETLSSFHKLFDEQTSRDLALTPSSALSRIFTDENDTLLYGMSLAPIVDLEYMHYVSDVYVYFASAGKSIKVRWSETPVDFQAEDSKWDGCYTFTAQTGWNKIAINAETRFVQIIFEDGYAPVEMTIYGYQCGEGDKITLTERENPTMGEMMGMCGFVAGGGGNTPISSVICSTVLREYHNFGWSYDLSLNAYISGPSFFAGSWMCNFDTQYRDYTAAGLNVIPCIQWNLATVNVSNKVDENNKPVVTDGAFVRADFFDRFNPHTYFMYSDSMFALAARYGANNSQALASIAAQRTRDTRQVVGLNYIRWIELGNEPDGSWNGVHNYYSAYQYAALLSAGYDGHCSTLVSSVLDGVNHFGVKNADPTMGVAMAGIAAADCNYVNAINYWMMANRLDGKAAYDAFNGHHYMAKQVEINGKTFTVGVSPEEGNLKEVMSNFVNLRDKYFSEKEVWITEFGWDTNQSYTTETSAHAYGDYTGRQVQAMWLTRSYLILSACGVDKATMYMCEDAGVDSEVSGKYGTCGVIGFERDENGNTYEVKKDSYYYMYTLKNTLGDYRFKREIQAYDENVMIYEYESDDGKIAYAVWCKTSDGTVSEKYQLKIDSESATATLVEAVYGDIDGLKTTLTSDNIGYVTINVSENPVYVVVD